MKKLFSALIFRHLWLLAALLVVWLCFLLFCRMYWYEPGMVKIVRFRQALKKWHCEHNGLKIAVLSDIHLKNTPQQFERLRYCVDLINQERPAFVFLLGDYLFGNKYAVSSNPSLPELSAELKRLQPSIATFAVLGNHDNLFGRRTITRALQDAGIIVLENECQTVMIGGKPLQILGLPDTGTRGNILWQLKWPDPAVPTLVLAHNPQYFEVVKPPYELTFSGHLHGGQIRFPLVGALLSRMIFLNRFQTGWQKKNGLLLLNNNGLGTTGPQMRLNCLPEIVLLTLYQGTDDSIPEEL